MRQFKKRVSAFILCMLCVFLFTSCSSSGNGNNVSLQAQKDSVLSLLNSVRASNGANTLVEDEQADIVASRMANSGIDYAKENITVDQFKYEYYDAALTTVQGRYCTAIYADTAIPTRTSDFDEQDVSYKSGKVVGIAIRRSQNIVTTVIIVY